MRYFHRTSLSAADVLAEADEFFGRRMQSVAQDGRTRTFRSPMGEIRVAVKIEGGHYTHVALATDDVGESEVDKLAKRFLAAVHQRVHDGHEVRGAY